MDVEGGGRDLHHSNGRRIPVIGTVHPHSRAEYASWVKEQAVQLAELKTFGENLVAAGLMAQDLVGNQELDDAHQALLKLIAAHDARYGEKFNGKMES